MKELSLLSIVFVAYEKCNKTLDDFISVLQKEHKEITFLYEEMKAIKEYKCIR